MLKDMYVRSRIFAATQEDSMLQQCQEDYSRICRLPEPYRALCHLRVSERLTWEQVSARLCYTTRWVLSLAKVADRLLEDQ